MEMTSHLLMRQATIEDIKKIEVLYLQRVMYNDANAIHQWNDFEVTWKELSKLYHIDDCYIGIVGDVIVSCMMVVDVDKLYWPSVPKGEALYLHKLCVHPMYRGLGFSEQMISYFKDIGRNNGYASVRLDVRAHKSKLRALYERCGFQYLRTIQVHATFQTALYEYSFQWINEKQQNQLL